MISVQTALLYTVILGSVIFLCRFLPFILLQNKSEYKTQKMKTIFEFAEKAVPAVAMTVLAFNVLVSPIKDTLTGQPIYLPGVLPLLIAASVTAILHLWKRNALISIFGGTALYMLLNWYITL